MLEHVWFTGVKLRRAHRDGLIVRWGSKTLPSILNTRAVIICPDQVTVRVLSRWHRPQRGS
jgi:hypothetical protein